MNDELASMSRDNLNTPIAFTHGYYPETGNSIRQMIVSARYLHVW